MIKTTDFDEIYTGMVAGRIINHGGDVELSIFYNARDILGTENIHLLISQNPDDQFAYYLAQRSTAFASVPDFTTQLAAAFPGAIDHQGDGAYLLSQGSISAALIKDGDKFRLITNNSEAVLRDLDDMGLTVHPAEGLLAIPMMSITGRHRHNADKFAGRIIKLCAIVSTTALVVGLITQGVSGMFAASLKNTNNQRANELSMLVSKIEHASPLSQQLADLQKVSATVVRAGGWIESYEMKDGKTKFAVSLPEWVTQDFIQALGTGATAEHDSVNNLIKVKKE